MTALREAQSGRCAASGELCGEGAAWARTAGGLLCTTAWAQPAAPAPQGFPVPAQGRPSWEPRDHRRQPLQRPLSAACTCPSCSVSWRSLVTRQGGLPRGLLGRLPALPSKCSQRRTRLAVPSVPAPCGHSELPWLPPLPRLAQLPQAPSLPHGYPWLPPPLPYAGRAETSGPGGGREQEGSPAPGPGRVWRGRGHRQPGPRALQTRGGPAPAHHTIRWEEGGWVNTPRVLSPA